jgi:hypothetical protein
LLFLFDLGGRRVFGAENDWRINVSEATYGKTLAEDNEARWQIIQHPRETENPRNEGGVE